MTFYIFSIVNGIDEMGKPQPPAPSAEHIVRQVSGWDVRSQAQLMLAYRESGSLTFMRVGAQHSPGRPYEKKGEMTIASPYLVSIEEDVKYNIKQPLGPRELMPRPSREGSGSQ